MSKDTSEQKPASKRSGIWGWIAILILGLPFYFVLYWYIQSVLMSRIMSDEHAAKENLRVIYEAQKKYESAHGRYAKTFAELMYSSREEPAYLLGKWDGPKVGYNLVMRTKPDGGYEINANPVTPGWTGTFFFYVDQSGTIRMAKDKAASASDRPYGE